MEGSEFWSKVKLRLKELGRKQEWLSQNTNIPLQNIRNKIHLQHIPPFTEAMNIINALSLSWEEFEDYPHIEKNGKPYIRTIPVIEQAFSAGHGQFVPDYGEIKDYVAVPSSLKHLGNNVLAAYVRGDSMEPTFFDGDTIIYDTNGYDGRDGIYTIIYAGMGYVKRLQKTPNGVKIVSDNKNYEPMFESAESDDFRVIGRVQYVVHKV